METPNDWLRSIFVFFPLIATLTGGFWMRSNLARMSAAIAVGAVLWVALSLTEPQDALPTQQLTDFTVVLGTGFMCFCWRGFLALLKRMNEA